MDLVEQGMQFAAMLPREGIRAAILNAEASVKDTPQDIGNEVCTVRHFFAPGCYAREITMPEGMVIIGKIHRHAHVNVISAGRVRVLTEHGGCEEFSAPCTFVSQPGTKRLVYILEDTVWTTLHITNSTDLEEIEREIIAPDYAAIEVDAQYTEVLE